MIELQPAKFRGETTPLCWQRDRQMNQLVISCGAGHLGIVEQEIPPSGEFPMPVKCIDLAQVPSSGPHTRRCDWEGKVKLIGYRP